ncbi:MAG: nucleoside monophosphate kinase [bacterium]
MMGAPGCGKGTLLKALSNLEVFSMSGDLMNLKQDSIKGPLITDMMDGGYLVPSEITIPIFVMKWLLVPPKGHVALDGVVRTCLQADGCLDVVARGKPHFQIVPVLIDVPLEICRSRILNRGEGRNDDADVKTIERRFANYVAFTLPTWDYLQKKYSKTAIVIKVTDGNQPKEVTAAQARKLMFP